MLLANSSIPDCGLGRPWPSPDWEKHESQRFALVGPDAALWTTSPRLALALAASIPSGRPLIVHLRNELRQALFGDGLLPFVLAERSGEPIVVVHHGILDAPPPAFEFVYVGTGDLTLHPSLWTCPFCGTNGRQRKVLSLYIRSC